MKRHVVRPTVVILVATLALLAIGGLAVARQLMPLSSAAPAASSIHTPGVYARPTPRFFETGGPHLSELTAIQIASRVASGPVGRVDARRMSYGDVVTWLGTENLYYDRGREMYVVAVSAPYEGRLGPRQQPGSTASPCNSYFTVIDATDGTVLSIGCGGPNSWPASLPAAFGR